MFKEIERKFLVHGEEWRPFATSSEFCQGYIYSSPKGLVRIRTESEKAFLTIKGPKMGISRTEYEYPIPLTDANELLETLANKPLIYKTRHKIPMGKYIWEIDEYRGDNTGLIVAEIELESEDDVFEKPNWIGKEITHDARYRNAALAKYPYSQWAEDLK